MKVLLTGATGFLGSELLRRLPASVTEIRVLSRNAARAENSLGRSPRIRYFDWNAEREVAPATALEGVDAVFHLAGENVGAGRWTAETKRRIVDSRRLGTANLVTGLNRLPRLPFFFSASAIGLYGDAGDTLLTEESPRGAGFLAEVCEMWESEARKVKAERFVIGRFGVVFGPGGGVIAKLLPVFRAGIGGRVGDGAQWMGWIHRDDLVSFLLRALADPKFAGVYNVVAPEPVRNATFAHTFGHVLHRPSILPVPAFALKLALGEMAKETVLASQRVKPGRLLSQGFSFQYPELEGALRQIAAT